MNDWLSVALRGARTQSVRARACDLTAAPRHRSCAVIHFWKRVPSAGQLALVWRRRFLERAHIDLPVVHLILNHVCVRLSS